MKLKPIHTLSLAFSLVSLTGAAAMAHGPVVVLSKDTNGKIVTNQMDMTPQNDSTYSADYPVGPAARSFPFNYNASNLSAFDSSAYAANKPTNLQAIPMVLVTSGSVPSNTGYYGQMEITDAEGNASLNTGPGYAYGNGGFTSGTVFQITFADTLKYWNRTGGTFTPTPLGEQLQSIRSTNPGAAYAQALTSNGAQTGNGLQVTVSATQNGGSHSQLSYRLMDSTGDSTNSNGITDGLFLASFHIGTASTSPFTLTSSDTYYFLFEKNVGGGVTSADLANANNYINTMLVPEPGCVGLIGVAGLGLMSRRRAKTFR